MVNIARTKIRDKRRRKGKGIKDKKMLRNHSKVKHKCSQCNYTSTYNRLLKNHETLNHSTEALSHDSVLCDFETESKAQIVDLKKEI